MFKSNLPPWWVNIINYHVIKWDCLFIVTQWKEQTLVTYETEDVYCRTSYYKPYHFICELSSVRLHRQTTSTQLRDRPLYCLSICSAGKIIETAAASVYVAPRKCVTWNRQPGTHISCDQRRRALKKTLGGAESCGYPTDICKFPTKEIMGAQNFNFARIFSEWKWGFPATSLVFLEENFSTNRKFSGRLKFGGRGPIANPLFPLPRRHWFHRIMRARISKTRTTVIQNGQFCCK